MSIVKKPSFADLVSLRSATMDDVSAVRYVHMSAFRILAGEHHDENEIDAFVDIINSPEYAREIVNSDVVVASVEGEIVGTAGWTPADDNGRTARIRKVFVRPLFNGCGIGTLLVNAAEERAKQAGFEDFSVRANVNSLPFFERLGYEITSYGVMPTGAGVDLPVAFLRKYDVREQEMRRRAETPLSERLRSTTSREIPVTHESYWHHTTEH